MPSYLNQNFEFDLCGGPESREGIFPYGNGKKTNSRGVEVVPGWRGRDGPWPY